MTADRGRGDGADAAEDAVRKIQRLKKAFGRSKLLLTNEEPSSLAKRTAELAAEIQRWDEQLEAIRCDMAELLADRDRWRIAHDKLRERIDHHSIAPRSEVERKPQSSKMVSPRPRAASDESQDFSAIDQELERLNASMLRELSSE